MADDQLVLDIQFENTSNESFALAGELNGEDFLLHEVGGGIQSPVDFSQSLTSLDDGRGIAPGARIFGTLTFAIPSSEVFELHLTGFAAIEMSRAAFQGAGSHRRSSTGLAGERSVPSPRTARSAVPAPVEPGGELGEAEGDGGLARAIDDVLALQAEAMERYDLDAYLSTFVPERRRGEQRIFERLRQLPLVAVQLERAGTAGGGLDGGSPAESEIILPITLRYLFDGQDDNPFVHDLFCRLERRDERWLVAELNDTGDRAAPWRRGELVVHRSHHFLLYTRPELRALLVDLAAEAEAAYATLYAQGLPLASGYVVDLVADRDELARIAGRPGSLGVAVARYSTAADGSWTVDSQAFIINGRLFARRRNRALADQRQVTVTHELVHLALAADTRPYTPAWLKEGVAVYFSAGDTFDAERELVRRGLDHLDLEQMTRSAALGEHDQVGRQTSDEYLFAGCVVSYLASQHGTEAVLDLYRGFAHVPPNMLLALALDGEVRSAAVDQLANPGAGDVSAGTLEGALAVELTRRLVDERFDLTLGELERATGDWLRLIHR